MIPPLPDFHERVFHVGTCVPDIEAEQHALSAALGLQWAPVMERDQPVWTPQRGSHTVRLRFTYSTEGPQHIELLTGPAGSFWDPSQRGLHHIGFWSDDIAGDTEHLVSSGWELVLSGKSPAEGYGSMTYLRSPLGLIVEPVRAANRPKLEAWWAGSPLGDNGTTK